MRCEWGASNTIRGNIQTLNRFYLMLFKLTFIFWSLCVSSWLRKSSPDFPTFLDAFSSFSSLFSLYKFPHLSTNMKSIRELNIATLPLPQNNIIWKKPFLAWHHSSLLASYSIKKNSLYCDYSENKKWPCSEMLLDVLLIIMMILLKKKIHMQLSTWKGSMLVHFIL